MFPELFPQPKHLSVSKSASSISFEATLVTCNVSPQQKKAIRALLSVAGFTFTTKNSPCVISVTISAENCKLCDVPENLQKDYYELTIKGSEISITAPSRQGVTWGIQTLACLCRHLNRNGSLLNLSIRDWPSFPYRGIFVEDKWVTDRMTLDDWKQTIDTIAELKMNLLGIGLYGCWGNCRFEGGNKLSEFLMVPVKGHPRLSNVHSLRWFSPAKNVWNEENYKAFLTQKGMLAKVVKYADDHGVTIIPFVNSLGHNTLIPRLLPNLSAKNADGNPTQYGYCLSNPELKSFLTEFYGGIIEQGFPNGCKYFHIQLDEVWPDHSSPSEPTKITSPWCECDKCKTQKMEDMLKKYILWLVKMLVDKGVEKVFIWNDQLTRHMDALDDQFAKELKATGLKDHLVIDWWNYSNTGIYEKNHVNLGKCLGFDSVVSPMTCYYNWSTYSYNLPNICMMMKMAYDEGAQGAISYAVHSPSHLDHEALMAAYAWDSMGKRSFDNIVKYWAEIHYQDKTDDYLTAVDIIRNASGNPVYARCLNYQYTYVGSTWPQAYPGEALDKLEGMPIETKPTETLELIAKDATKAADLLKGIIDCNKLNPLERNGINALRADAIRIQYNAKAFAWLLKLRKALAEGKAKKAHATACKKLHDELIPLLAQMEQLFPSWLVPSALHALSPLLEFLQHLYTQISTHPKSELKEILWTNPPRM